MKGYIFGICLMMVGTIALAYNNLDYKGYPSVTGCYGECYEEYVRVNGTMAEILQVYVQRHQYYAKKGLIQRR